MLHLTTNFNSDRPTEVRFYPDRGDSYEVQVFLGGDSHHSIYMSAETARAFAQQILDTVPAEVSA
jgi:hypothetical protein